MNIRDDIDAQAARRFEALRTMKPQPGYAAAFPWDSRPRLIVVPLITMEPGQRNAEAFSIICEFNGAQVSLPAFRNLRIDAQGIATVDFAIGQLQAGKPTPDDRALFIQDNQIALLYPFVQPKATKTDYEAEIQDLLRRRPQFTRRVFLAMLDDVAERAARDGITINIDAYIFANSTTGK